MKTLRFAVAAVALLGSVSAFATNARVESMGKKSTFIMDDISIFDNAANISLYPNFLIGELGTYTSNQVKPGENQDPNDPWFGGIFSLDIGGGNSLSIAGALNRKEERLLRFFPEVIINADGTSVPAPQPATNFDGFLGANFNNKAIGLHIYFAHQDGLDGDSRITGDAFVSALQLDGGINFEISSDYSIEIAGGMARLQYGPTDRTLFDSDLLSYFAHGRFFSRVQAINGHLIPVAHFRSINAPGREEFDVGGGMGVDAAFDRGFFWLGLDLFYNKQKAGSSWKVESFRGKNVNTFYDYEDGISWGSGEVARLWQFGGTISFGIERNIWWDWFVIRVGGQKTVAYADYKASKDNEKSILCPSAVGCYEDGNYFVTNPVNDGTRDDNVGFGIGINIEEKLKIDATVAEDIVFRNPFQGPGRLMSRVSATYSF
ncbi:MAG: hypothetical protein FWB90_00225 [Fibromonadales bacterium]|nr:hypothetical protein [Fibromonadales bacterium]